MSDHAAPPVNGTDATPPSDGFAHSEPASSKPIDPAAAGALPDDLPRAFGEPALRATLRLRLEDFQVDERLGFAPDGAGEHLLVRVRKRGANTAFVASALARWAGIPERAVGYAGMKDRHAVTTQAFSLHLPGREAPVELPVSDEFEIIERHRHRRKLPRGALAGNAFRLTLRDVVAEHSAVEHRLSQIAKMGFPNYFGVQRFGRAGGNIAEATRMFAGQRMGREKRSILLSAARSWLFNAVLAKRIDDDTWTRGVEGEVWMLDGSHSVFGPERLDSELSERALRGDIHPTGPMWGSGELRSSGRARCIEDDVAARFPALCAGLERAGLRQERRSLRVRPAEVQHRWLAVDVLELEFFLPSGAYATSLLHALGEVSDRQR